MASVPKNFAPPPQEQGCKIDRQAGVLEATFNSDPAHLAPVRNAIESLCAEGGFDSKATAEIGLVLNEAVANVIRHAYGSASNMPVQVRAELKGGGIEITLRDWGNGECPVAPADKKPADPLTPGGLGLVCMHNMMDQILFTPQPRGMLLTMRRTKAG